MTPTDPNGKKVMTAQEVSDYLKIPLSTVWSLTKRGKLKGTKVGKHWRYIEADVLSFLTYGSNGNGHANGNGHHDEEKRDKPRLNGEITAVLHAELSEKIDATGEGTIRNISEEGLFFIFAARTSANGRLEPGDPVMISFKLPEMNGHGELHLRGRVIRKEANGTVRVGVKFRGLDKSIERMIRRYVG